MGRLGSRPLLVDGRSDIVPADRADVVFTHHTREKVIFLSVGV